ncbi:integration host factor, actinobacterial type [Streptomyces zhihengii]|uniref:Integration host factor n=1 Tax=Streptomyces zhihengii TaxID=1818004 RepID=A0ABS2V283_9ACTN|nr:integration host factor, actinobacterial type [Streptomyces zhihengii]MBM9623798.1 integration host factor [Streptomyces zhihengii]
MTDLPTLTPEQRAAALQKAALVRRERSQLLGELKSRQRSLPDVLRSTSDVVGKTKVRQLLEAIPGVGKVRAAQVMEELAIPEGRRVQGLGPRQRESILQRFPARA